MSAVLRGYRIPRRIVQLGEVLDVQLEPTPSERLTLTEWRGWLVAIPEHGFELPPGAAKLFLFKPNPVETAETMKPAAARAYQRWHKRLPVDALAGYEVPNHVRQYQGRAVRIGYRSDKWGKRGKAHDYDHDFREHGARPPKLYTDAADLERSTAAVLVGGDMHITEGGIA